MATLPPRDQRYLWLRYQVVGYTEERVHDFEQRSKISRITNDFKTSVNRRNVGIKRLFDDLRVTAAQVLRLEEKLEQQREDGVRREIALRKEFEDQRENGRREWQSKLNEFQDIMLGNHDTPSHLTNI
ncbi:hypothetical protein Tco_0836918 [Tanacetum coccineum]